MSRYCVACIASPWLMLASITIAGPVRAQIIAADTGQIRRFHGLVKDHSTELVALRAAVDAARARQASTGFGAPIRLESEIEDQGQSVKLGIAKSFLAPGVTGSARALAGADVELAELELALAERRLQIVTEELLVRAAAARAVANRLASESAVLGTVEEGLRVRFAVADARYVDVLRIRTEQLRAQSELAVTEAEGREVRLELWKLTGVAPTPETRRLLESLIATVRVDSLTAELAGAPTIDSLVSVAPDVRRATVEVSRATAARSLTSAQHRSDLAASI